MKIGIKSKEELDLLYSALANSPHFYSDIQRNTKIRNSLIERVEKAFGKIDEEGSADE